mgnify:CR=1 FL=1
MLRNALRFLLPTVVGHLKERYSMKMTIIILIGFLLLSYSCYSENDIHFNSKKWQIEKDLENFPYRNLMINDIVDNNLFDGFQYDRLIDFFGSS